MIEIKDLLSRFQDLILSGEVKKETIKNILKEVVGIDIKTSEIDIKNGTLYLNIKPIYKNEVLINKDKILSRLLESLGEKTFSDLR